MIHLYKPDRFLSRGVYGLVFESKGNMALKYTPVSENKGVPPPALSECHFLLNYPHPNIIKCHEAGIVTEILPFDSKECELVQPNNLYVKMVMDKADYCLDDWLKKMVAENKQSTDLFHRHCVAILFNVISALAHLHKHKIIHGDIKFQNILVNQAADDEMANPVAMLCDFGLAQKKREGCRPSRAVIQTVWFRAPEIILEDPFYDESVDMWSIGVLMLQLFFFSSISCRMDEVPLLLDFVHVLGVPNKIWAERAKIIIQDKWPECPDFSWAEESETKERGAAKRLNEWTRNYGQHGASLPDEDRNLVIDLLASCLQIEPKKRISAAKALEHKLFQKYDFKAPVVGGGGALAVAPEHKYGSVSKKVTSMLSWLESCSKNAGWWPDTLNHARRIFFDCWAKIGDGAWEQWQEMCAAILILAGKLNEPTVIESLNDYFMRDQCREFFGLMGTEGEADARAVEKNEIIICTCLRFSF